MTETARLIKKRDESVCSFDVKKIAEAIFRAAKSVGGEDKLEAERLAALVSKTLWEKNPMGHIPSVEEIQDMVEKVVIEAGHAKTAKAYILYRAERNKLREAEVANTPEFPSDAYAAMFSYHSKLSSMVPQSRIYAYKRLFYFLKAGQEAGTLALHPQNNYLGNNELAVDIYKRKYFLKDLHNNTVESRPEDMFRRLASYVAAVEDSAIKQDLYATKFYNLLYNGYFLPGGRVIAGAGDLYRLKTLANCFVSKIAQDNIESIYKAAYECARTYSFGGGIGVDISSLRPQNSVVHNAADHSTGAVSFMEIYSLTTGLIGQSGRRGALMLTLDVKHPDVFQFINAKTNPNWVTKQITEQCKWSGKFDEAQLLEIEKQIRENTQVRFANISLKISDEFMLAVDEQTRFGKSKILVYKKRRVPYPEMRQDEKGLHYSYGIPSKNPDHYEFVGDFETLAKANQALEHYNVGFTEDELDDEAVRDVFGDLVLSPANELFDIAVRRAGDFLLYFSSNDVGEVRKLVKARDVWDPFVAGNYRTAEPGLIFWSSMAKYSPSNYVGRPILSTNPCGEVPLEDGGACNLGSVNLSMFVKDGYTPQAQIDWKLLKEITWDVIRFLDNVVLWNETLNPLEKQRIAARETRRLGLGVMGIADMFNQLGMEYDSDVGIELLEKIMSFIANQAYRASANLGQEKGSSPLFNYEQYQHSPFFKEALDEQTRTMIKEKGLRNIAILSIAPTGTISNVILGYRNGDRYYVGVSGGIEPVFALYYTRRSESFGNKFFKVFHSTVQAYLDNAGKSGEAENANDIDSLRKVLPAHFFRTAHFINPMKRVEVQGIAQKYVDHSISSTVNLPESIDPETISDIYLTAWKRGLKGITIYRDGSRYPILSVQAEQTQFAEIKAQEFSVTVNGVERVMKGEEVFTLPSGILSTPYHAMKLPVEGVSVARHTSAVKQEKSVSIEPEKAKVCKIEIVNGQPTRVCSD